MIDDFNRYSKTALLLLTHRTSKIFDKEKIADALAEIDEDLREIILENLSQENGATKIIPKSSENKNFSDKSVSILTNVSYILIL